VPQGGAGLTRLRQRSDHGPVRPPRLAAAITLLLTVLVVAAPARVAVAVPPQQPDAPADDGTGASNDGDDGEREQNPEPQEGDSIIPDPNSGREPTEAGDRGGALQVLVFVLIVAGVGGIVAKVVRDARRARGEPLEQDQSSGPYSSQAS
jgi:hypothetical protein